MRVAGEVDVVAHSCGSMPLATQPVATDAAPLVVVVVVAQTALRGAPPPCDDGWYACVLTCCG